MTSSVVSLVLKNDKGETLSIKDSDKDVEIKIPRKAQPTGQGDESLFVKPSSEGKMTYHTVFIGEEKSLRLKVRVLWLCYKVHLFFPNVPFLGEAKRGESLEKTRRKVHGKWEWIRGESEFFNAEGRGRNRKHKFNLFSVTVCDRNSANRRKQHSRKGGTRK